MRAQFNTKAKYLRGQRELLVADAIERGTNVKTAEAAVVFTSVDVPGFTAYLETKHACDAGVRPVYADPAFRRLRWQGFRATQLACRH